MKNETTAKRLEGRVALVTGGSKGLGKAIAFRLLQEGARVVICGREATALTALRSEACQLGFALNFTSILADVTHYDDVERLVRHITSSFGRLNILVNNVGGVKQFGMFHELSPADWALVFNENLMSVVLTTQAMLPLLRKSPPASIVNIASVAGVQAGYFNCHYGAMKAAVVHLTKYLANDYGKEGIRANVVCPSTIQGGVWQRDVESKARMDGISHAEAEKRLMDDVRKKSVLDIVGKPEDVAGAVAFLASDDARMITGSCFNVDGGTVRAI